MEIVLQKDGQHLVRKKQRLSSHYDVYKPVINHFRQKAAETIWMLYYPKNIRSTHVGTNEAVKHCGAGLQPGYSGG